MNVNPRVASPADVAIYLAHHPKVQVRQPPVLSAQEVAGMRVGVVEPYSTQVHAAISGLHSLMTLSLDKA